MKKSDSPTNTNTENELEGEIRRRLAVRQLHSAILVLVEIPCFIPFSQRETITEITGSLTLLERRLIDLAPSSHNETLPAFLA
jgi:hypothetical protein